MGVHVVIHFCEPRYLLCYACYNCRLLEYCVGNGAYKGVEFTEDDSSGQEWEETFNKFTQLGLRQAIGETCFLFFF